ncbi:hypothetical protein CR970_04125 [Candidatus Saccharibacteria bacterium]|nr:MAG: hypothetical protein CR970_04125 [Candidatus Saccharibacteria bacterium]
MGVSEPAVTTAQHVAAPQMTPAPQAAIAGSAPSQPTLRRQVPQDMKPPSAAAHRRTNLTHAHAPQPTVDRPARVRQKSTTKPAAPRQNRSLVLNRRINDKATMYKRRAKQQRTKSVMAFAMGSAAAVVMMGGMLLLGGNLRKDDTQTARSSDYSGAATLGARTDQGSVSAPSEVRPSTEQIDSYSVAPLAPRAITIKTLDVYSRVTAVDLSYDGVPMAAQNVYDFGWLANSARPGDPGVSIMTGYSVGPNKDGPLASVSDLKVGDVIQIERGDGSIVEYYVVSSERYSDGEVDMNALRRPVIADKPGLNILTNLGRFNVRTNQFEERTAIFAAMQ